MQHGRAHEQPLNANTWSKLRAAVRATGGRHLPTARRVLAVVLLLSAGVLAIRPQAAPAEQASVLVTTRDLPPGQTVGPTDVTRRDVPSDVVPAHAVHDAHNVIGRTTSTAMRSGEPITDLRVLGPELTRMSTGDPEAAAVPVRLADPTVAAFLRPGRRVDIITTAERPEERAVLAERAPVVGVRQPDGEAAGDKLVLVGLPRDVAVEVAATAMTRSVTVTLR